MKQKIFAICDSEEMYAYKMAEYFLEKVRLPYDLHLFTKVEELQRFAGEEEIEILLIAEGALRMLKEEFVRQRVSQIFVLRETECESKENMCCIDKYQNPEAIVRTLLESVTDSSDWTRDRTQAADRVKMIGIYSPIKRCMQTSFALTMGQVLAKTHKVLYLSFECYSGIRQMLNREFAADMMDVMYYFRSAREKLAVRLPAIVQTINGMDFIPSANSILDLREIDGGQWKEFCEEIAAIGEYEFLILDLDDCMNGLFDLLRQCYKIYTITREDRFAVSKMVQYEQMLKFHELEDIADKTVKCKFPIFKQVPVDIERMTYGDLANYVRAIVKEDLRE